MQNDTQTQHEIALAPTRAIASWSDTVSLSAGGGIMALSALVGIAMTNTVFGDLSARQLADAVQSASLYYGSAILPASFSVIALMLNALGTARNLDAEFDGEIYAKVYRITLFATILLACSVVLLLILCLPVVENDSLPTHWYSIYYWLVVGLNAFTAGIITITGIQLFQTVSHMISKVIN